MMSSLTGITELEDLTLFLQERTREYDASIDTTTGSTYYNTVILPLLTRLGPDPYNTPIRDFVLGRLATEFPDLILQDGEPMDDLVVKPMQILLETFRRQIQQVSNNQSVIDPTSLNEREADNLGANYFVRRRQGGVSVGVARLYYSAPQGATVTPNNAVYDSSGHRFYPVENQSISSSNMLFNVEDNLFYFDVIVRAETEGTAYNLAPNALIGIEELASVVKVANKAQFEEGADKETTEAYLSRVESSLTEKSLVTFRGINARLTDVFNTIRLIQVIGYGDPEMQRDILTGESDEPAPYAVFLGDVTLAGPQIDLSTPTNAILTITGVLKNTFLEAGVAVGDSVVYTDVSTGSVTKHTVTAVTTSALQVTPDVAGSIASGNFFLAKAQASITISDIPGGILEPTTLAGEIVVNANEVHLGGTVDVFVRAGDPIQREMVLEGVLDGSPLHFGVDLESFGERANEFVHVTPLMPGQALRPSTDRFGASVTDHILIRQWDDITDPASPYVPWKPTADDVGRYVQILAGGPQGLLSITSVLDEEYYGLPKTLSGTQNDGATTISTGIFTDADATFVTDLVVANEHVLHILSGADAGNYPILSVDSETQLTVEGVFLASAGSLNYSVVRPIRCVRVQVSTTNEEQPLVAYTLGSNNSAFDTDIRIVESVSTKNRVRDRDGTRLVYTVPDLLSGSDLAAIGASVGDSVVIETGDDAGIYTVRKVEDWLDTGDTLILDRDLTKTVIPTGNGDGSGLRYRIADALNVDLVSPRVTKIPLGNIFYGDDLTTLSGSAQVSVTGTTNFLLAGASAGDILEILEGTDKGTFTIKSVTGITATLDVALINSASQLDFTVYKAFTGIERPMVRVKDIELLDSNSQPTGIMIPYGSAIDARALGVFSNRAEGSAQESFTGETQVGTGALNVRLYDASVNFLSEGAVPGYRLNILNTDNSGAYVIVRVGTGDGLPSDNHIEVSAPVDGGVAWTSLTSGVHYYIGLPSVGVARLYFQEPTSANILTGLAGGRIRYEESGTPKEYFFSAVDGYRILPPQGSTDDKSRNIRTVRNYETPTPGVFESILELTDTSITSVLDQEILVGDILEVNEQIPFRRTTGEMMEEVGIFGAPSGLRTVAGSNRVTVPTSSLIDFVAMNSSYPLVGQVLFIDDGPDTGEYVIEEVVNSKTLRLSTVMTSSTESVVLQDGAASRDATLTPGTSTVTMEDVIHNPGTQIGNFITIFESTRGDIDGTYEIKSIPATNQVELVMSPTTYQQVDYVAGSIIPFHTGLFSWVNTTGNTSVSRTFRIYKTVPKQAQVLQVATKRVDLSLKGRGNATSSTTLVDSTASFITAGVVAGDRLEILAGPDIGVYPIATVAAQTLTIVNNTLNLLSITSNVPYRVWGGLHGSKKMVTVGQYQSDDGQVVAGEMMPFRVVRPLVYRMSSTTMNDSFDGSFYYLDIQVESLGSGDEFNLNRNDRLVVTSGISAEGYTYTVTNNTLTFSPFEQVSLNFGRRFLPVGNSDSPENLTEVSGRNLQVTYETSTTAKLVHDLMRSDAERPINANPLGRHFLPSYVYTHFTYRGGSSAEEVGPVIEDYINNLGAQDELEVSDLEAFITKRGATSIDHPVTLAVVTHDIDRALVVNRSENSLGGTLEVPYNGTGRISCFFATLGEGLKVERQS
jgi:hypothetical protein